MLLFHRSVISDSLWPHGLLHARLPCPSLSPGACSDSCPLSQWCHPTISSSVIPFSSCPQSSPASGSFQWVGSSHQVAKVLNFSFSISPSNEYSGWIFFRIDWFDYYQNEPVFVLNQRASGKVKKVLQCGLWHDFLRLDWHLVACLGITYNRKEME